MVGMLLGMGLARLTAGNVLALWVSFLLLTAFHMYGKYPLHVLQLLNGLKVSMGRKYHGPLYFMSGLKITVFCKPIKDQYINI
jgi:hypothetical protein